jgi:molybdopterin-binding protein
MGAILSESQVVFAMGVSGRLKGWFETCLADWRILSRPHYRQRAGPTPSTSLRTGPLAVIKGWGDWLSVLSSHSLSHTFNDGIPISARNKLRGTIEEIQLGDVVAHVVVRVGDHIIESVITRRSADEMNLKKGDTVSAVVKATEVMIQKD